MQKPLNIFAFELVLHAEHQIKWRTKAHDLTGIERTKNLLKKEISRIIKIKNMIKTCNQYYKFSTHEINTITYLLSREFQEELQLVIKGKGISTNYENDD